MRTPKHTPGPWAVNDIDTGMSDDGTIINLHGMVIVSSVYGQTTEIAAANAALIAAAPVMYADLCAVRDYLFELYDEGNAKAGEYAASLGITIEQAEGQHHE